jgi:hypothetical protein
MNPKKGSVVEMKQIADNRLLLAYASGLCVAYEIQLTAGAVDAQLRKSGVWNTAATGRDVVTGMDSLEPHCAVCGDGGLVSLFDLERGDVMVDQTAADPAAWEPFAVNAVAMVNPVLQSLSDSGSSWGGELATVCSGGSLKIWDSRQGLAQKECLVRTCRTRSAAIHAFTR